MLETFHEHNGVTVAFFVRSDLGYLPCFNARVGDTQGLWYETHVFPSRAEAMAALVSHAEAMARLGIDAEAENIWAVVCEAADKARVMWPQAA